VEAVLAPTGDPEQQPQEFTEPKLIEQQLCRLEDAVLLVVYQVPYLMDADARLAYSRMARLPLGSQGSVMRQQLMQFRQMQNAMHGNAAGVVQRFWKKHRAVVDAA
jgi:hypothetical protein